MVDGGRGSAGPSDCWLVDVHQGVVVGVVTGTAAGASRVWEHMVGVRQLQTAF